ncbi:hypothetical protein SAMN05192583_0299 [Sphingomonas gellani]|uniref:Uncharacterized protein n=1 Tax=Sphingomonas gellani TaxID=1166340 RepID=A0A1H7YKH0_9SPHN|nr:hypothetical protein [Sphingomonas gellani]SEM46431.1 hypothetical protein SAMN05192583_0299 [Sphingomonas gellani]
MPDTNPSNTDASDIAATTNARDDRNAASVLNDQGSDTMVGGGGLGGVAAADDPLSGTAAAGTGTAPNAVIDVPLPAGTLDEHGQNPSATRAVQEEAAANPSPDENPLSRSDEPGHDGPATVGGRR